MMRPAFAIAPLAFVALGCVRVLPPAPPPPATALSPQSSAPAEGMGRIVLDVGSGRARVDEIVSTNPRTVLIGGGGTYHNELRGTSWYTVYVETSPVPVRVTDQHVYPRCEAPCTLELPLGPHDLHVQSLDDSRWAVVPVEVTAAPRRYRIGLGHTESASDMWRQIALGVAFLLPGASLLTAGAVDWTGVGGQPSPEDHDRVQRDSIGLTALGGALLVAGIVGLMLVRPTSQETVVQVDP
jgi:hypothetical protein